MVDNKKLIQEIRTYAKEEKVPIMQEEGIKYLIDYIKNNNIKDILEIGTAIGYSSIMMALNNKDVKITTIEKDEKRYLEAINNIKKASLEDRIHLIFNDALTLNLEEKYDLIFIDAAKSKNKEIFEKYQYNLKDDGTIITDNMHFHGLIFKDEYEIKSKNLKGLLTKIKEYHKFLEINSQYKTNILNIGDGIAISTKNKE